MNEVKRVIAEVFSDIATGLENGNFGSRPKIALTGLGGELGEQNSLEGAKLAAKKGVDVKYIGSLEAENVTTISVSSEEEGQKKLEELFGNKDIDAVVTMHYPFPIGVSTVGRVITPAIGKEMFIATTTGTSSTDRVEAMVYNTIYGIITAKACGIANPTVGILNVDGARQTEIVLNRLASAGYPINFCSSARSDGGAILRGNDVLKGTPDILVTDSLTGNVLIKMLSAYTTGGGFESTGYGYGPGIGADYDKLVLIVSRASGAPLIANALCFAEELVRGEVMKLAKAEFEMAKKAGIDEILKERVKPVVAAEQKAFKMPEKEPCTASISGIEVMDLDDAAEKLWQEGIYAETGMGCTGPIVMMSEANKEKSEEILRKAGYVY